MKIKYRIITTSSILIKICFSQDRMRVCYRKGKNAPNAGFLQLNNQLREADTSIITFK